MKKIMLLGAGLFLLGSASVFAAQADSLGSADLGNGGQLVSMDSSSTRISQLERRLSSMERDMRSQNDYIRGLERDLNDLRRRR